MAYQTPRRVASNSTPVAVASNSTALKSAIAATPQPNGFYEFMQPSYYTRTKDPREPNATTTENDACQDFRWTSPTEQGDTGHALGYTLLDWGGKICWDSIGRKVMFAANGANPGGTNVRPYSWQYSKYSSYDEATDAWSQERGIKGDNEASDPDCIVHMLGNNCIDVAGRRFFKKKFRERLILVKNLTTGTWTTIPSPSGEADYNKSGGLEFVPGRGASGMLWGALSGTSGYLRLYEIDPSSGSSTLLLAEAALGNQWTDDKYGMACVYNPRAFSGAGGVLVGVDATKKLTVPASGTPTIYDAGTAVVGMYAATGHRVCRDPVGDGWYHFVSSAGKIYRTAGNAGTSAWTEVATMPAEMAAMPNMVLCPIDREGASDYGAIWVLCSYGSGPNGHRAWLYKPA